MIIIISVCIMGGARGRCRTILTRWVVDGGGDGERRTRTEFGVRWWGYNSIIHIVIIIVVVLSFLGDHGMIFSIRR